MIMRRREADQQKYHSAGDGGEAVQRCHLSFGTNIAPMTFRTAVNIHGFESK